MGVCRFVSAILAPSALQCDAEASLVQQGRSPQPALCWLMAQKDCQMECTCCRVCCQVKRFAYLLAGSFKESSRQVWRCTVPFTSCFHLHGVVWHSAGQIGCLALVARAQSYRRLHSYVHVATDAHRIRRGLWGDCLASWLLLVVDDQLLSSSSCWPCQGGNRAQMQTIGVCNGFARVHRTVQQLSIVNNLWSNVIGSMLLVQCYLSH